MAPLSEGTALVLTTARYFTPKGRSVQKSLPGTALAGILHKGIGQFSTDRGRPIPTGEGVEPDERADSWQFDSWMGIINQTTAFINFAQEYIERHGKASGDFEVESAVLADFERYLHEAGIRVPSQSWERSAAFLKMRLKVEMLNLTAGMVRGDQAETKADPQVEAARKALEQARRLLH